MSDDPITPANREYDSLSDMARAEGWEIVRFVEQPKCPECKGTGEVDPQLVTCPRCCGSGADPMVPFAECSRCGGAGGERMVALGEVVEWLREPQTWIVGRVERDLIADALEAQFGGGDTTSLDSDFRRRRRIAEREFGGGEG